MTTTSQNGWAVLSADSPKLRGWVVPAKNGQVVLRLREGSAGFLLAHLALWYAESIAPLKGKVADDWAYAYRPIRGQTTGFSNHASGTACDLNASQHPLGIRGTFAPWQYVKIRARLLTYRGCIRWGGDYINRADEMHFELNKPLADVERVARKLSDTPRGKRILHANPGQRAVIFS